MKIVDSFEYKRSKERRDELETFLLHLDNIIETLYNNITQKGVWDIIMKIEEVRIEHYMMFHEYDQVVQRAKK